MRYATFLFIMLLMCAASAEIRFSPPSDWIRQEPPPELSPEASPEFLDAEKASSADQTVEVTIVEMAAVDSLEGANDFVKGQVSGMKREGYIHERTEETSFDGFPARYIMGEFRSDEYEGAYLFDSYVVFSDSATFVILIGIDDAAGGRELAADVGDWITISGNPAVLAPFLGQYSRAYELGRKVGYYGVYVLLAVAVVLLVLLLGKYLGSKKTGMADKSGQSDGVWQDQQDGMRDPLAGSSPPPLPKSHSRLADDPALRLMLPVGRSGWAIAAGYLGLFSLIIVPAPVALIISIVAIFDISRSAKTAHPKRGMGRAVFGLVMGFIGTALLVLIFGGWFLESLNPQ